jgi:hypothetical protein
VANAQTEEKLESGTVQAAGGLGSWGTSVNVKLVPKKRFRATGINAERPPLYGTYASSTT